MPDSNSMVDKAVNIVHITSLANLKSEVLNYGKLLGTTAENKYVYCSPKGTPPPEVPSGTIIYSNNNQSNGNSSSSSSGFGSGSGSSSSSGFGSGSSSSSGLGSGLVGGPVRGQIVSSESVGRFISDSEDPQLYEEQLQEQEEEQQLKVKLQQQESKFRELQQQTQQRAETQEQKQQQAQLQQEEAEITKQKTITQQELQKLTQKQTETRAKIEQQQQPPNSELDKNLNNLSLFIIQLIYKYRITPTIVQKATTPPEVKKIDDLYNKIISGQNGQKISSEIKKAFKRLPIEIYQTSNKTDLADELIAAFNKLSTSLGSKQKITNFGDDLIIIKKFIDSLKRGAFTNIKLLLKYVTKVFERSKESYYPDETSSKEENKQALNKIFDELLQILSKFELNDNDMRDTSSNKNNLVQLETTFKKIMKYTIVDPYKLGGRPIIKRKTKKNKRKKTKRKSKKRKTRRRRRH